MIITYPKSALWGILAAIFHISVIYAQPEYRRLQVGDKAPALHIVQWLKGEPVPAFKKGRTYVAEFSGTWCPPCRKAIPHLTELAREYAGEVTMVSIYLENNDREDTTDLGYVNKVRYFMEAMGDRMDFTLGVDVPQQTTKYAWGVRGVPSAYIVDGTGHIIWIGHPVDLGPVLEQITAGTFDAARAAEEQEQFKACLDRLREKKKNGDYKTALAGIDSLIEVHPYKTWLYYLKFGMLAGDDDRAAYAWLQWLLDSRIKNFDWPHFVGGEFRKISPENRDYTLELKALDRTIEESETKYLAAYPLSLKASTYTETGDFKKAVAACEQAIAHSQAPGGNADETARYEKALVLYKYRLRANEDTEAAGAWLRTALARGEIPVDSKLISTVTDTEDYTLALELVDKALKDKENEKSRPYFLGRKATIYAAKGNFAKAIELCKQVITMYNDKGMTDRAKEYEELMAKWGE